MKYIIVLSVICFIIGILFLVNGYKEKKEVENSESNYLNNYFPGEIKGEFSAIMLGVSLIGFGLLFLSFVLFP